MAEAREIIGRDVRALRRRLGESQAEFARRFGVHQSTIDRWEENGPRSELARIKIAELIQQTPEPEAQP